MILDSSSQHVADIDHQQVVQHPTRYFDINRYTIIKQRSKFNMHNLLPPSIISILVSITDVKYLPIRVRQAAPTSTPAVWILDQDPGCYLLSSALSVCTSLTPEFTTLAPSQQAPCLCYSSTVWAPDIFDDAVETCASFASTAVGLFTPMPCPSQLGQRD